MGMGRFSMSEEGQITYLHRHTGCQHRIDHDKGLTVNSRRCHVFGHNLQLTFVVYTTVSTQESILSVVKDIEETLMQRKTGTKDGSEYKMVSDRVHRRHTKGRLNIGMLVVKHLAHLDCHELTDTLDVTAKTKTIFLDIDVAYLTQVLVEHAIVLREVDDFHIISCFLRPFVLL